MQTLNLKITTKYVNVVKIDYYYFFVTLKIIVLVLKLYQIYKKILLFFGLFRVIIYFDYSVIKVIIKTRVFNRRLIVRYSNYSHNLFFYLSLFKINFSEEMIYHYFQIRYNHPQYPTQFVKRFPDVLFYFIILFYDY